MLSKVCKSEVYMQSISDCLHFIVVTNFNLNTHRTHPDTQQPLPEVVHALNILRALYRDTRLGDSIVPFVAEGVMIAVEGFSSTLWPVSSYLLSVFTVYIVPSAIDSECSLCYRALAG